MRSVATFRPGHRRSRRRSSRSPCSLRPTQSAPRAVETNRSTQRAVTSSSSRSGKTWPSFFNRFLIWSYSTDFLQKLNAGRWRFRNPVRTDHTAAWWWHSDLLRVFVEHQHRSWLQQWTWACSWGLCVEIEFKRAVTKRGWRGEGRIVGGRWAFHILKKSNLAERWKHPGCQS